MASTRERLILASASPARAALLCAAGVEFSVEAARVDEAAIKRQVQRTGGTACHCASALAAAKALQLAVIHPDALVIGADQLLVADGEWFDKPPNLAAAREQLLQLRGRTHRLVTAVCIAHDSTVLWQATSIPELTMRWFSERFLEEYVAAEGEALLGSVGAYRLEGRGVQLFWRINGDHFAVLGLPLVELLGFLRERGAITE